MSKPNLWELNLSPLWESFLRRRKLGRTTERAREEFQAMLRPRVADPYMVDYITSCVECHLPCHDTFEVIGIGALCEPHAEQYYTCGCCENRVWNVVGAGDDDVCESCRDNYYRYCDYCEEYYHQDSTSHYHDDDDDDCCEAPAQQFTVRNDGQDPLANDQRVKVTLPAGVISDEGLSAIVNYIRQQARAIEPDLNVWAPMEEESEGRKLWNLTYHLHELDNQWQRKDGNYTKRLSRLAYKKLGIKVPASVISGVGNIASEHSRPVDFEIEVTRNLNLSADDFAHDSSCWWTDYSSSRCALKSNGGFGLRTFQKITYYGGQTYDRVEGRAWVMPLRVKQATFEPAANGLVPTFETLEPDAFVVFNGYGDLEGYNAARILSHMAGMTYRKISFSCTPMYVNSESGYLIAPEEIAEPYTDGAFRLSVNSHSDLYETERIEAAAAAQTETEKVLANA